MIQQLTYGTAGTNTGTLITTYMTSMILHLVLSGKQSKMQRGRQRHWGGHLNRFKCDAGRMWVGEEHTFCILITLKTTKQPSPKRYGVSNWQELWVVGRPSWKTLVPMVFPAQDLPLCLPPRSTRTTPGVRFTKQVQQPLSLILNAELIYSEIENAEFSVPHHRIWVNLFNSV